MSDDSLILISIIPVLKIMIFAGGASNSAEVVNALSDWKGKDHQIPFNPIISSSIYYQSQFAAGMSAQGLATIAENIKLDE